MTDDDDAEAFERSKREITKIPLYRDQPRRFCVQYSESDEMKQANVLPEGRPARDRARHTIRLHRSARMMSQTVVDDEERPFLNLVHDAGTEFDNEVWNRS